jgi:hypothetical protein
MDSLIINLLLDLEEEGVLWRFIKEVIKITILKCLMKLFRLEDQKYMHKILYLEHFT